MRSQGWSMLFAVFFTACGVQESTVGLGSGAAAVGGSSSGASGTSTSSTSSTSGAIGSTSGAWPGGCVDGTQTFTSYEIGSQNGTFTVEFDATPLAGTGAVIGLAKTVTSQDDLDVAVRFDEDGDIDAYNGSSFMADALVAYAVGEPFHFRLVVDLGTLDYSAYVTPDGGEEQPLGTDYEVTLGEDSSRLIDELAMVTVAASGVSVCNLMVAPLSGGTTSATGTSRGPGGGSGSGAHGGGIGVGVGAVGGSIGGDVGDGSGGFGSGSIGGIGSGSIGAAGGFGSGSIGGIGSGSIGATGGFGSGSVGGIGGSTGGFGAGSIGGIGGSSGDDSDSDIGGTGGFARHPKGGRGQPR